MSGSHRIRLQAAWDVDADGTAWTRSFGSPTGVGPRDRIWLVIERPMPCSVALNGLPLPAVTAGAEAWRHDVTADLQDRNELRLEVAAAASAGAAAVRVSLPETVGRVALEIETNARRA